MTASTTHLVVIPSYNAGAAVYATVRAARAAWAPVWVAVDGSDDGTAEGLLRLAAEDPHLRVEVLPSNQGKGAAVLHALTVARQAGFTHALTMDSDGQHPADLIDAFMRESMAHPEAMVLGRPVFDASAPRLRVRGRRLSNGATKFETLGAGIDDSLYGFRVYPIAPLVDIMGRRKPGHMRRFDFDPEAVVRLSWQGVRAINLAAPVKYLRPDEGGVSHFRYLRDNLLLFRMHVRLLDGFFFRLPMLVWRRLKGKAPFSALRASTARSPGIEGASAGRQGSAR